MLCRYWNAADSEELIAQHYPFFLDFYRANVTLANEKSDVVRYVLMHQFGGRAHRARACSWRPAFFLPRVALPTTPKTSSAPPYMLQCLAH